MLKKRHYPYLVAVLFIIALALRLWLAFQTPNFTIDEAYFHYRQADLIKENLVPSYLDSLSYSGRTHIFHPVYDYILAFFSFILGTALTLKIIPNILACALIIIIYLMVLELTKNRNIALFSAAASAFIPVFMAKTINSASIFSFTLPLIFYLIYCFMRIRERRFLYQFLFFSFVLSITSAIAFLFVFAMLIYMLLIKLEYKIQNRIELEVILFVTFLTLWINILIYKKAFLFHSYGLIWQNIPIQILATYFRDVDIIASVTSIGLIPLMFGIYAVSRYMFKERDKRTYLLMAFALSVAFLLWFKLITFEVGLMFLGAILVPLLGQALNLLFKYLEKTKISSYKWVFWTGLIVLLVLTSVIPSVVRASESISASVSQKEVSALSWIKDNTPEDSVILATIAEGNLISALAERKNVADNDFILIRSSSGIFEDIEQMYTAMFKTNAVELLDKYDVDYIYLSPRAMEEFGIEDLKYAEEDCFELVYDDEVKVYRSFCEIKAR